MLELFNAYLPWDRACAIARGESLPDRAQGAALFVDISGFTPLTEALTRVRGPRRGVEELTVQLNLVYGALVGEVHRYGGSVIGFAGDAITCWFDQDDGRRAVAAAFAMQRGMGRLAWVPIGDGTGVTLAVKASVAAGAVRRFLVGDEAIQLIDVIAGDTLARMAAAGGVAGRGEVVLDRETANRIEGALHISEWRLEAGSDVLYAVIHSLRDAPAEAPRMPNPQLTEDQLRPWLLGAVYRRLASGQGEFLTELRSAVPIFLKFAGIDYDGDDDAGRKLNGFVRWVQRLMTDYGGFLVDVTVGDKGSYLYSVFGAPIAHEDDLWRALTCAAQLRRPPAELDFIASLQIGVSRGVMRTGSYGGAERRTYGVLGAEVNMAARLMEKAEPWQVLASGRVRAASGEAFTWEDRSPLKLKGKAEPMPVAVLREPVAGAGARRAQPADALPLVGRVRELRAIEERLTAACANEGQIVVVNAEAGVGKSRLALEATQRAAQQTFTVFQGQCVSHGGQTSYLAWGPVWTAFFELDPSTPPADAIAQVARRLAAMDPAAVIRLPLLAPVLNLPIEDNEVTAQFDAKLRKSSLEALLVDCVRHRAATARLLFVIEDTHWMDPLSRDLLELIGRAAMRLPVVLLVTERSPEANGPESLSLKSLPNTAVLRLDSLPPAEAEQLLRQKLARLFGADVTPTRDLVDLLVTRSEGNPFYLEELLNFLKDQGVAPGDPAAATSLELPTSLHSLVMSRMDQLTESQRMTLKLASVVGRVFQVRTLLGANPALERRAVETDLEDLARLELTPRERPEPDLAYAFKHVVTQEVAYETLPFAMRARLHNDIGLHLERAGIEQLDLLAFHFDRSGNEAKQRVYLLKAGESAQSRYANAAAIEYFRKVLPLLPAAEQIEVRLRLGQVLELVGRWSEAGDEYAGALAAAMNLGEPRTEARCRSARGELRRKEGDYVEALRWLDESRRLYSQLGDETGLAEVLHLSGTVNAQQGEFERARELYHQSMAVRRRHGDKRKIASLLSNLGIIAWFRNDLTEARRLYEESLTIRRELGDRWSIANSLNNLALLLGDLGEITAARGLLEECLAINRELGDRWAVSNSLSSLGDVTLDQGDYPAARRYLREGTVISRELGDRVTIAFFLEQFAELAVGEADAPLAFRLASAAAALREGIQSQAPPNQQQRLRKWLERIATALPPAEREAAETAGRALDLDQAISLAFAEATSPTLAA